MAYPPTDAERLLIQQSKIFAGLSAAAIATVLDAARCYRVGRGGLYFNQGEPADAFYVVLHGRVRLAQLSPAGQQIVLHHFGPGDVMGAIVLFSNTVYPVSAAALTDSAALGWQRETTLALMEQFPRLAINGLELVSIRFLELQNRYRELATERVERRIARALLRLSRQSNGHAASAPPQIHATRQEIAELSGTTLYTVSRICRGWEARGLLETGRKRFVILDPDELTAVAEDHSPATKPSP